MDLVSYAWQSQSLGLIAKISRNTCRKTYCDWLQQKSDIVEEQALVINCHPFWDLAKLFKYKRKTPTHAQTPISDAQGVVITHQDELCLRWAFMNVPWKVPGS